MHELIAHPAACIFPMISEPELSALASDIKENGLLESIVLFDGQILDGRNRYAACKLAGVDPHFTEESPKSPVIYVLSKNMHRRHLTTSQRAAIAAETIPMLAEEAKKRQEATRAKPGERVGDRSSRNHLDLEIKGSSREIAAKAAHIAESTLQQAMDVRKSDPELFEQVKAGKLTTNTAKAALTDSELREQIKSGETRKQEGIRKDKSAPYVPDSDRKLVLAEAQKRKMSDGLATVAGVCHGLSRLDVAMAVSVCSAEEIEVWATKSEEQASELRRFAKRLRGAKA